jgi:hypothetical protein
MPYNNPPTMFLKHAVPYAAASAYRMPFAVERQVLIGFASLHDHTVTSTTIAHE